LQSYKTYLPLMLSASSGLMHSDPSHRSWTLGATLKSDVGSSCALVDSGCASDYANYLFGGSSSRFLYNQ